LKKLLAILLICCFLLNIIGFRIFFYFRQVEVKSEMKKLLRLNVDINEERFAFFLNDIEALQKLKWKGDDEFSLNGEMYDIIGKKIEDEKIVIRCIRDKEETALVNKLKDNCRENEKCNKVVNELFQLLQTLFYNTKSEDTSFGESAISSFCFPFERLPLQVKKIPTPPPQLRIPLLFLL